MNAIVAIHEIRADRGCLRNPRSHDGYLSVVADFTAEDVVPAPLTALTRTQ